MGGYSEVAQSVHVVQHRGTSCLMRGYLQEGYVPTLHWIWSGGTGVLRSPQVESLPYLDPYGQPHAFTQRLQSSSSLGCRL